MLTRDQRGLAAIACLDWSVPGDENLDHGGRNLGHKTLEGGIKLLQNLRSFRGSRALCLPHLGLRVRVGRNTSLGGCWSRLRSHLSATRQWEKKHSGKGENEKENSGETSRTRGWNEHWK